MVEEKNATEKPAEELVWNEDELKKQIRSLENQILVAQKQHGDIGKVKVTLHNLELAIKEFANKKFTDAEIHVIDVKEGLIEIIDTLTWLRQIPYFASVWGLIPILTAIIAMGLSFGLIVGGYKDSPILFVPLWAPLIGVIGASVQILVGVVNDYKEDSMITKYKRIWYSVLPIVGFVFGFIAILLIQAGLINMTQGQFSLNQTNITELNSFAKGDTPIHPTAYSIIICFLAGYATEWFMGLLGNLAPTGGTKK